MSASPSIYILGTLAILLALPQAEITGLGGIMDAITATGARIGVTGLAPIAAILIVLSTLGGVGVWLAAPARLPFVAGIDHYLPSAFGRLHPRYGTPHIALLMQAGVAAVCAILGQAGETPKQAYEILVSLGVVAFFIPYIAMFAAMIRLQREPAGPEVVRPPGRTAHGDPARLDRACHLGRGSAARVRAAPWRGGRSALRDQGGGLECTAGGERRGRLGDRQRAEARRAGLPGDRRHAARDQHERRAEEREEHDRTEYAHSS